MKQNHAFTLVELSIVLVILGLLIGGVLTGQSLIRAAELRSITTQQARYITSIQTFRDKYLGLPGDITSATSYWGAVDGAGGNSSACFTTASTNALTCNGNGDGKINSATSSNEQYRAWQQLANAGLIEGTYDGITHGTTDWSSTPANSPAGRITATYWRVAYFAPISGQTWGFDGNYEHHLLFGALAVNNVPGNPALKPDEAYNVDMKTDDGKPATGRVVVNTANGLATCTDTSLSTNMAANYLLTSSTLGCALYFRQAF